MKLSDLTDVGYKIFVCPVCQRVAVVIPEQVFEGELVPEHARHTHDASLLCERVDNG